MLRALRRGERGLSMIEVLVAAVLLAVVVGALAETFASTSNVANVARIREQQTAIGEQTLEDMRSCITTTGKPMTGCQQGTSTQTQGAVTYTITSTITPEDSAVDGIGPADKDGNLEDYFMLNIKITQTNYPNVQPTVLKARVDSSGIGAGTLTVQACAIDWQQDDRLTMASCPDPKPAAGDTSSPAWKKLPPPAGFDVADPTACTSTACHAWACADAALIPVYNRVCVPGQDSNDYDNCGPGPFLGNPVPTAVSNCSPRPNPWLHTPDPTYEEALVYPISVHFTLSRELQDGTAAVSVAASGDTTTDGKPVVIAGLTPGLYRISYSNVPSGFIPWAGHSIPSASDVVVKPATTSSALAAYRVDPAKNHTTVTLDFHSLSRNAWWALEWQPGVTSGDEDFCGALTPLPGRVDPPMKNGTLDWRCSHLGQGDYQWTWNNVEPGLYEARAYFTAIESNGKWYGKWDSQPVFGTSGYIWVDPSGDPSKDVPSGMGTDNGWVDYVFCWPVAGLSRADLMNRYGYNNGRFYYAPGGIPPNQAAVNDVATLDSLWHKYVDPWPAQWRNQINQCGGRNWNTNQGGNGGT
jgi:type II secretory pathway pseudopilin PulG